VPRTKAAALCAAAVGDGDRDGEEEWRERPRSRATNLTRRAYQGSLTPLFPLSLSVLLCGGSTAILTVQNCA